MARRRATRSQAGKKRPLADVTNTNLASVLPPIRLLDSDLSSVLYRISGGVETVLHPIMVAERDLLYGPLNTRLLDDGVNGEPIGAELLAGDRAP